MKITLNNHLKSVIIFKPIWIILILGYQKKYVNQIRYNVDSSYEYINQILRRFKDLDLVDSEQIPKFKRRRYYFLTDKGKIIYRHLSKINDILQIIPKI